MSMSERLVSQESHKKAGVLKKKGGPRRTREAPEDRGAQPPLLRRFPNRPQRRRRQGQYDSKVGGEGVITWHGQPPDTEPGEEDT